MKFRTPLYFAALLLSTAPLLVVSCKKDETPTPSSGASSAGTKATASATAGEAAVSASAYGFAARLPKDTESFVAVYRLGELWKGFKDSNFVKKVKSNEALARELNLQSLLSAAESGDAKEGLALAGALLEKEAIFVLPDGFTQNFIKLIKAMGPLPAAAMKKAKAAAEATRAAANGSPPGASPSLLELIEPKDQAAMIQALADTDLPPVLMAVKASDARQKIDGLVKQALDSIAAQEKQVLESGSFKLDGKYEFQTLTFKASKALPPEAAEQAKGYISQLTGDPAKGEQLTAKLFAKTIEISWGWVDDSLVFSLGSNHAHVKLAAMADSVLGLPEVSGRVAQWRAKQPLSLSYVSQKASRALAAAFGGITDSIISVLQLTSGEIPFPIDGIIADLKKLGTRSAELWPNDASALIAATWWEGGLNAEFFGGAKPRAFDSSKPLSYGSLAGPATVVLSETRVNEAFRDRTVAFIEEVFATLWDSFQKNIKPGLPEEAKTQVNMAEAMGLPLLKSLWQGMQDFRAAMGAESALLVNLDGAMPDIPQLGLPPEMKQAKIPRILVVSDLKDRAKLTASWEAVSTLINTIVSMAGPAVQLPINPTPVSRKEGTAELWGFTLPLDTGDFWPHAAVAGTRWYLSTSPSFTREAAAKSSAPSGPACGAHLRVNFDAVWDYAASWIPLVPNLPEQKQHMTDVLNLVRVLGELEARTGEDKGDSHGTLTIRIRDAK